MITLRRVAQVNPETPEFARLAADEMVPFVPLEAVWSSGLNLSRSRPKAKVDTGYTRFRDGDILIPKITPTFQADRSTTAMNLHGGVAAGTTELHVVRPGPLVEPRYLRYIFSSRPFLLGGQVEMTGVAGQKRVPDEWLRNQPIYVPNLALQRAIADFLDAETVRIDAVIAKRGKLLTLLDERSSRRLNELFSTEHVIDQFGVPIRLGDQPSCRLGYVARIQTGLTLDASRETGDEAMTMPYLRVANVQDGHLDLDEIKTVTVPRSFAARCLLRAGDVLMTEGGDPDKLGRGTVWPGHIAPCLHQNHVFAVRPDPPRLLPAFLALVTRTSYARRYFEVTASKTTGIASTSSDKIAAFRIPLPPIDQQRALVYSNQQTSLRENQVRVTLQRQVALLKEHREALITAAVTGELEIPGAA